MAKIYRRLLTRFEARKAIDNVRHSIVGANAVGDLAALLTLVSFIFLAAAYVPRNHLKAKLQHPMTLAVKVWAFAHLIANNTLADIMLFGSFLVWAILVFRAARRRPAPTTPPPAPTTSGRLLTTAAPTPSATPPTASPCAWGATT